MSGEERQEKIKAGKRAEDRSRGDSRGEDKTN